MKKYTPNYIIMTISAVMIFASILSCKKGETPMDPASVSIKIERTSASSIEYTLTTENAVKLYYRCVKSTETANSQFTEVEASETLSLKAEGLDENCEYTISAYAENAEGAISETVNETAVTTTLPSLSLKVKSLSDTSIVFIVSPVNADAFDYIVIPSENAEDAVPDKHVDSGEECEITADGLLEATHYTIIATASNKDGEKSQPVTLEAITEEKPVINVTSIECDETSAIIEIESKNASKMYYCLTKKGEAQPEKEKFTKFSKNTLYFYELENEAEYTLWLYAENRKGYVGKITNETFKVQANSEKGYKASITEISSFDAIVNITWDESKYSGAYWIVDSPENLKEIENFDWKSNIDNYIAKKINYQGTFHFNSFKIKSGELQRMGVVFVDLDGNIDLSTSVWRDVKLDDINFEVADCSVNIEEISHSYSNIRYKITNKGADYYYFGYDLKSKIVDMNDFAIKTIQGIKKTDFDTEIRLENLIENSEYIFVAVASDKDGNLGKITSYEFTTDKIELKNNSQINVTLSETGFVNLDFNIEFGENTVKVVYVNSTIDISDAEIVPKLAKSYYKINTSGITTVNYLTNNTTFYTWFASVNENGDLGEMVKFVNTTKKIDFSGKESVSVSIDNIGSGDLYDCSFTITPDENIQKYYYTALNKQTVEMTSNEKLAERLIYSGKISEGKLSTSMQMSIDSYLIILPVNKEGNLCEIVKYFIK